MSRPKKKPGCSLLKIAYRLLKTGTPYQDLGADFCTEHILLGLIREGDGAAAVVCAAAVSACTAGQSSPASLPAGVSLPRSGGMPGYYVAVAGRTVLEVVVRASGDGRVTGSVAIPVAPGRTRAGVGGEPFAGADGRHFVIVVSRGGDLPGVSDVTLFQLTVSPDGRPGKLSRLNFDSRGVPVIGAALSPDGRMLALSMVDEFTPAAALYGSVEVISLASGATRTWTGHSMPGYWSRSWRRCRSWQTSGAYGR